MSNKKAEYKVCNWCKKRKQLSSFYDYENGKLRRICNSCYQAMIKKRQEKRKQLLNERGNNAEIETHSYDIVCPMCFHKHFRIERAANKSEYDLILRCYGCNNVLHLTLGEFLKMSKKAM